MNKSVALLRAAPILISALAYAVLAPLAPAASWVLAIGCGVAIPWIDKAVALPPLGWVANGCRAAAGAALGLMIAATLTNMDWIVALAPLLSGAAAAICTDNSPGVRMRCADCRGLVARAQVHRCPRCAGYFCPKCYVPALERCRCCEKGHVRILPEDPKWWLSRLGTRVESGNCRVCRTPAEAADLRTCANCGWPICTECWDDRNAVCGVCDWRLMDISADLQMTVTDRETTPSAAERFRR